jgi:deoxyribonuclease V
LLPWPGDADSLAGWQDALAALRPAPWTVPSEPLSIGGCAVASTRRATGAGSAGEPGFAAAVVMVGDRLAATAVVRGVLRAPYAPGRLALREGPLLEEAVRALAVRPEVLLVRGAGRDHPRRAGLAVALGAALDLPTVGVTREPLAGRGDLPVDEPLALAPIRAGGDLVAFWVRTRAGARPLVAHAGWRTSPEVAADVVRRAARAARLPEPLREALRLARAARDRR